VSAALPYGDVVSPWPSVADAGSPPGDADAALVARARGGEEAAFEALVSRHEAIVYRTCRRILADPDDALDATQEAFLRAYRAIARFRGDASFRTWLVGIAINACRNRLASAEAQRRRRTESLQPASDERPDAGRALADPAPGPEADALAGELRNRLLTALAAVSPEHREVLVLREIEGLEYGELARAVGVAEGTVKSRLARARAALRAALEGVWP